MTWRLVAIRPSGAITNPAPSPCRLPSRPAWVITTTAFRADSAICSVDFAVRALGGAAGSGFLGEPSSPPAPEEAAQNRKVQRERIPKRVRGITQLPGV